MFRRADDTSREPNIRVLDLFSGIGGFSLGLERAGMRTVAFCENEPFCRSILKKHWPQIPIYPDVKELSSQHLTADRIAIDIISGGFPCQDLSSAASNRAVGISGNRSGLWKEYARLIGELRPGYAIIENVPNLLAGGSGEWFGEILCDLASLGYDAEWHCVPAAGVGAPHIRDRVWIVAHPSGKRPGQLRWGERAAESAKGKSLYWSGPEPAVKRVAHGVPDRLDRLTALGNTLVPQIAEIIGRAIMLHEQERQ